MNNTFTKIFSLLKSYKALLIPVIPLLFFLCLLIFLFTLPSPKSPGSPVSSPTSTQETPSATTPQITATELEGAEWEGSPENLPGFIKKENRSDGATIYFFSSENPNRENITIISTDNKLLFSRTLSTKELELATPSLLEETYGAPEQVIKKPTVYSPNTLIYLYTSLGKAYIGDPFTDVTFESQEFPPLSPAEYVKKFGSLN